MTKPTGNKRGRPSSYTPQIGTIICARLSSGLSLRKVCRANDVPNIATVQRWLYAHADFREQYTRAMEARGCSFGERSAEVAERVLAGEVAPDVGRVAMQGFQWAAARMAPKVFGDRLTTEHTGKDGAALPPINISSLSNAQLDTLLERISAAIGLAVGGPAAAANGTEGGTRTTAQERDSSVH